MNSIDDGLFFDGLVRTVEIAAHHPLTLVIQSKALALALHRERRNNHGECHFHLRFPRQCERDAF